jgi:histidine triad (HIT) family protein
MFDHAPEGYRCPFCAFVGGQESAYNAKSDIVYENESTLAFVCPKWWVNNHGHVLVIPKEHFENIYSIPDERIAEVYKTAKRIAIAIRSTYDCDGTSTRQHNEPAGHQDAWHFHAHVYPRYSGDQLYRNDDQAGFVDADARAPYAEKLRNYFAQHKS